MNKLTIFFLIILSSLVTNVQAAEAQTPKEILKEMRKTVREIVAEHIRISRIEDPSNRLAELENFQPRLADGISFLRRPRQQQQGMRRLQQLRRIERAVEGTIKRLQHVLVMDIDTEEMDIDD